MNVDLSNQSTLLNFHVIMKVEYRMQYYVITNPISRTAANMKIVMSTYLSEKWSDCGEIW